MKLHIMQGIQLSDLQARLKNRISLDYLTTFLVRTGELCSTVMQCGIIVVKWVSFGGRVIRGFGKTFRDAIVSLSYQAWCN